MAGLNLSLYAAHTIVNHGEISSAGSLNLAAGTSITNTASAVMQAVSSLNISASSLVNAGQIASQTGQMNIANQIAGNLIVNNISGLMSAREALNVGLTGVTPDNISVLGGDIISESLNLSATNKVVVDVHELTGIVNVNACETSVAASTGQLTLGQMNLTGDPTFYNTGGNVQINTNLVFPGQNLAIVATGNILSAAGAGRVDTSSTTANGGSILMLAGAEFTSTGGPTPVDPLAPVTLTVLGPSAAGGSIDLGTSNPITSLTSASTAANKNGGNITLAAWSGAVPNTGRIVLPQSVTVTTGGLGTGSNGAVFVVAGATSGNAIQMGTVDVRGGTGITVVRTITIGTSSLTMHTGRIELHAANPVLPDGTATITNGTYLLGTVMADPLFTAHNAAGIIAGDLKAAGGNLSVKSGADTLVGNISDTTPLGFNGGTIIVESNSANQMVIGGGATVNGVKGTIVDRGGAFTHQRRRYCHDLQSWYGRNQARSDGQHQ